MIETDEGRRLSDAVNGHLAADRERLGCWVAVRLDDGSTDGTAYATRAEAIRHQLVGGARGYLRIPPGGITPAEASRLLLVWRMFHDRGFRLVDPEDRREPILPLTDEDLAAMVAEVRGR